ncbi:Uncharacterised protein [Bordetella pertussis]|nr:Uncharacterised protein [Bordetella pertussis]
MRCNTLSRASWAAAAHRRVAEVQPQDLVLAVVHFQLDGAPGLAQLGRQGLGRLAGQLGIEQARDLHGQRRAAGDDAAVRSPLPARPRQGEGIDAGVPIEPAVLVREQGFEIVRRYLAGPDRVAPDPIAAGIGAQRRAVGCHDDLGAVGAEARQREQAVQRQQGHDDAAGQHRRGQRRPAPAGQAPEGHGRRGARSRISMLLHESPTARNSGRYMSSASVAGTL